VTYGDFTSASPTKNSGKSNATTTTAQQRSRNSNDNKQQATKHTA
jgi:hypothetical protein